jgi:hypothetical protein
MCIAPGECIYCNASLLPHDRKCQTLHATLSLVSGATLSRVLSSTTRKIGERFETTEWKQEVRFHLHKS